MNLTRGDRVWTWHDTGAFGLTKCYGDVVASGPVCFTVQWESGIRQRFRHGDAIGIKRVTAGQFDPRQDVE